MYDKYPYFHLLVVSISDNFSSKFSDLASFVTIHDIWKDLTEKQRTLTTRLVEDKRSQVSTSEYQRVQLKSKVPLSSKEVESKNPTLDKIVNCFAEI